MERPIYSIRDVAVGFGNPFVDINDAAAKRNFAYAINNNDTMNFSPTDYDLYRLGTFNHETGSVLLEPVPVLIVAGSSVYTEIQPISKN